MYLLKKLAGKNGPFEGSKECCDFKQLYKKLEGNYQNITEKYEDLNAQFDLLREENKTLHLELETNLIDFNSGEEAEKTKKENI